MNKIIYLLLTALMLPGCYSHRDLYNVIPVNQGKPHASRSIFNVEDNDGGIFLNYNSQNSDHFSFFAIIKNKTDSTIFFHPDDIYAEAFTDESAVDTAKPVYLYSYNTDLVINALEKNLVVLEAQKKVTDAVTGFLGIVALFFSSSGEEEENVNQYKWDDLHSYENEKYEIESQMDFWRFEVLQPTYINPKERTAGLFYIPIKKDTEWFRIVIPIGTKEYVFNFKQVSN